MARPEAMLAVSSPAISGSIRRPELVGLTP